MHTSFLLILIITRALLNPAVKSAGSMKRIMQEGNLKASVSLDILSHYKHLIALGPVEGLKGEIIALGGDVYVSSVVESTITTSKDATVKAAMLVYSDVKDWQEYAIDKGVKGNKALESCIQDFAWKQGLSLDEGETLYHIIDWKPETVHTRDNHKQFAAVGEFVDEQLTLVGFYSEHHEGIFTHHSSYIHMHAINKEQTIVSHVDEINWTKGFKLRLPK